MKKLILFLLATGYLLLATTSAYNPSTSDLNDLLTLKTTLDQICSGNNLDTWDFYYQIKNLKEQFSGDEKLDYMLGYLGSHMIGKLTTAKNKAKLESKEFKSGFVNQYISNINTEITDDYSCTGRYNTLDNISFANNFPTALTMATRYREVNCGYYLPTNGDGPFQIISKDYGTGEINENIFVQSVQDFIDFSKAKRTQYKTKLGINLTYTGFDYTGIVNHGGLYNGGIISGDIVNPNAPKYLRDGYGEYTGAIRYGLMPKFLKVLNWEINNVY